MALTKQFERKLQKLFLKRTDWLRRAIGKKRPGRPHEFKKHKVAPLLDELGELALTILERRRARRELNRAVTGIRQWHVKKGKGHGFEAKQRNFKKWYKKHVGNKNCVYVFWHGKHCVYVGRTLRGHGRPSGWFDRVWFQPVNRIDIYSVRRPSEVPKVECLAMHLFDPSENDYWPAIGKYTKKCALCEATREIDKELKSIFRLR